MRERARDRETDKERANALDCYTPCIISHSMYLFQQYGSTYECQTEWGFLGNATVYIFIWLSRTRVQQCLFIYTNKTLYTLLFGSVVIFLYIQCNVCIPFDCVCELFRCFYSPCGFSSFIIGQNVVITHEINVFKHKQSNFSTIKNK